MSVVALRYSMFYKYFLHVMIINVEVRKKNSSISTTLFKPDFAAHEHLYNEYLMIIVMFVSSPLKSMFWCLLELSRLGNVNEHPQHRFLLYPQHRFNGEIDSSLNYHHISDL